LAAKVTECYILPCLQNKLFDHKGIFLSLKKKPKPVSIPVVSNGILKDPETDLVVGLAVSKTYIINSTVISEEDRNRLTGDLGCAWAYLRSAGPSNNYAAPGDRTEQEELSREAKLASVREFLEFFPFEIVREGTLSVEDDTFHECLINAIKNETISYKTFIKKNTRKQRASLLDRLKNLRDSGQTDSELYLELEKLLN
jgi:hypothetical protein